MTYADDSTVMKSGPTVGPLVTALNAYLDTLNSWFASRNLMISAPKSSATIYTTWSNEVSIELDIKINGDKVPTIKDPKILGLTLDPMLSFKTHTDKLKSNMSKRNNILKALAGTSWGLEKETLITTYKATGRALLNYACPIWSPGLSDSNWKELQTAQNHALRIATGCVKKTDIDHLHNETKIMPAKDHCYMLSKQHLVGMTQANHPNTCDIQHHPPRLMRSTLVSKFGTEIQDFNLANLDPVDAKFQLKNHIQSIHTSSVRNTLEKLNVNKVLNSRPPEIAPAEKDLPRKTRTVLAQLRSSYSPFLNSFLHLVNPSQHNDNCPDCDASPHDVEHLFACPNKPTTLTPLSLWTNPREVATFLDLELEEGPGQLDDND